MNTEEIKAEFCRADFYKMFKDALRQCGGECGSSDPENSQYDCMALDEVVNILAQNGIRIVYIPEKHMNNVVVGFKNPKSLAL